MPIQQYGQYTAPTKKPTIPRGISRDYTGAYIAPTPTPTPTPTPMYSYEQAMKKQYGTRQPTSYTIGGKTPSLPQLPSIQQSYAPAPMGGMGMPAGFLDLYKMILGGMMGGMQMPQLPAYPDIQGMLEEARTAAFQQATTQKGIATRKIGEQSEETLKGISEIEDETLRLAGIDAASRGVYESGLLTKAYAKHREKFGTAKTKVKTEEQSSLDALEAALLGIKSSSTMQGLPMMQQAWQNQYAASMNLAQNQWQQRQSGMQTALQLYQMQLQDYWRRQSSGQTYTSPSQYSMGGEDLVSMMMNQFGGGGYPEPYTQQNPWGF